MDPAALGRDHPGVGEEAPEDPVLTPPSISPPQSRDRKMVGDVIGAQTYASTAKCLNICALVLGLLLTIVFITLFVTGALMIPQMVRQHGGY